MKVSILKKILLAGIGIVVLLICAWRYVQITDREMKKLNGFRRVTVAICEEHQEVVPYWMKMFREYDYQSQFTLVHFDAHSDLAAPEYTYKLFKMSSASKSEQISTFHQANWQLGLMQSNDVFIISCILIGQINHVVWIKPTWLANQTSFQLHGYIGIVEEVKKYCICWESTDQCFYFIREQLRIKLIDITSCRTIKEFVFSSLGTDSFVADFPQMLRSELVKGSSSTSKPQVIVDIDLDYFGVENRLKRLLNCGYSFEVIDSINFIISRLICPSNIDQEKQANQVLLQILLDYRMSHNEKSLKKQLLQLARSSPCNFKKCFKFVNFLLNIFKSLTHKELTCLVNAKFCLTSSTSDTNSRPEFILCHGNVMPNHNLTEYLTPNQSFIDSSLSTIDTTLQAVITSSNVVTISIARSIRDGFTSTQYGSYVERKILHALNNIFKRNEKTVEIIYDQNLLFGKNGW